MSRRKHKKQCHKPEQELHLVRPDDAQQFDVVEFGEMLNLAMAAGRGLVPAPDPTKDIVNIVDSDTAKVIEVRFTRHPVNLAMGAILEHYQDDSDKATSFLYRLYCLSDLISRHKRLLTSWVRTGVERDQIHVAAVAAAAKCRIVYRVEKAGDCEEIDFYFPLTEFVDLVEEIAQRDYPHVERFGQDV